MDAPSWLLAVVLKPFAALVFFSLAYFIAKGIAKAIPGGRVKDVLYDRSVQRRHPWKFALLAMVTIWGVIALAAAVASLNG
jgi:4-hydroxybenzoate polyprenyltransferase